VVYLLLGMTEQTIRSCVIFNMNQPMISRNVLYVLIRGTRFRILRQTGEILKHTHPY